MVEPLSYGTQRLIANCWLARLTCSAKPNLSRELQIPVDPEHTLQRVKGFGVIPSDTASEDGPAHAHQLTYTSDMSPSLDLSKM
jgi:hypothetical protein